MKNACSIIISNPVRNKIWTNPARSCIFSTSTQLICKGVIFAANLLLHAWCFYGQNLGRSVFQGNKGEGSFLLPFSF